MKPFFFSILVLLATSCGVASVAPAGEVFDVNLQKAFDLWKTTQECKTAKIDEYEFQGAKVYVFDPGLCGADMFSPVYDAKGAVFCNLGGIMGNTKCNKVEFDKNSKLLRTVWKK
jgi:hypothetical protein